MAFPLSILRILIQAVRTLKEKKQLLVNPLYGLSRLIISRLPKVGIVAVLGLRCESSTTKIEGLSLAKNLLTGGYPVIVYDPKPQVVEEARKVLGGPVEFEPSIEKCVKESNIIVVTTAQDEFKNTLLKVLAQETQPRILVDCHCLLDSKHLGKNVRYIRWR